MPKEISLIVPVFNGTKYIKKFIDPLNSNFFKGQVIFVDNCSTDNSNKIIEDYCKKNINFKLVSYSKKKSSYAARNYGVKFSKNNIIAFTDIDCIPTKSYLNFLSTFNANFELMTGPINIFYKKKNIYEIFDKNTYLLQEYYVKNNYAATANLVITKEIFNIVGGFPEFTSGGDSKFCKKCVDMGFKINFENELIISHPARGTFSDHIAKAKRLGIGHGEAFNESYKNFYDLFKFFAKNLFSIFIPLNSVRIFCRINQKEKINFLNNLLLIFLTFSVNLTQRIFIIRTFLRR